MSVIADLLVKVGADVGQFRQGMSTVATDVEGAEGRLGRIGAVAGPVGLAVLGVGTAFAGFAIHAVDSATTAGQAAFELSEKFGLTGRQASQFIAVAGQLGVSSEVIAKGFQFLSKNTSALQFTLDAGGKVSATSGQAYKELGINVLGAGGKVKGAQELMLEAADAFRKLPDGPNKAALAMKLFGKSGTDMLPVLNQGRAGIERLMAAGQAQGTVMSNQQVAAAHKYFLEQQKLNQSITGITTQVGLFFMPVLMRLATFVTSNVIPAIASFGGYFTQHLLPAIQQVWAAFTRLLAPVLAYIQAHMSEARMILQGLGIAFLVVAGIVAVAAGILIIAVVGIVAVVLGVVSAVRRYWPGVSSAVASGVQAALTWLNNLSNWLRNAPGNFLGWARSIGTSIWQGIVAGVNSAGSAVMNAIKSLLPGGASGPVASALHASGVPGFQFGGVVQGPYLGAPVLIQAHAGERYLGAPGSTTAAPSGGGDIYLTNHFNQVMADPYKTAGEVGWQVLKLRRRR